jgi:hypothetical protein
METPSSEEIAEIVRQLKAFASSSIVNRRHMIRLIVQASTQYYPQSYLSKLWRFGVPSDREAVMESIFKVDDDQLTMEDVFSQTRAWAIEAKPIQEITFNRDTVSMWQLKCLHYALHGGRNPTED